MNRPLGLLAVLVLLSIKTQLDVTLNSSQILNKSRFPLPMCSTTVDELKNLRLITAIKTPYLPDGRFDLEAFDSLVDLQIANGAEGLIVGGTTGEGQLMTWDEHIMLIGHTVKYFGSEIKVIGELTNLCVRTRSLCLFLSRIC